jgi:hypothetical protein
MGSVVSFMVCLSLLKRSVINMGIGLYNKTPTKTKQLKCFMDFKQRLKVFILDHPFYSLNELLYLKKTIKPIINNTRTRRK